MPVKGWKGQGKTKSKRWHEEELQAAATTSEAQDTSMTDTVRRSLELGLHPISFLKRHACVHAASSQALSSELH